MDNGKAVQVAVQICPCYLDNVDKPYFVQTEQYIDNNANELNIVSSNGLLPNDNENTGFVHILSPNLNGNNNDLANNERKTFPIQHALPYGCQQENIYRETVLPLIRSFLDGYDTSFITYGQYRTGKSYTMFGPGFDCVYGESEQGIVQRAVRDIFADLTKRQRECRFSVNVAWVEVCGNDVHDILGGRIVQCNSISDVFHCLQIGIVNRSQMPSHSLFTMTLEQQWINANGLIQHRLSTASFCDLCATDRIQSINQFNQQINVPKDLGLQTLERIVSTLVNRNYDMIDDNNINLIQQYEETTLTKLLKDSFGGRAYALLILCVSPLEQDLVETTQNLEFAYKVQFIRNNVIMNTFSDNNLPITNLIDPMILASAQATLPHMPVPLPQALHYNPMISMEKLNATSNQNTFGLKFAATQWLKLVSNAEGVFNKLLTNNKTLNEHDRECIEEWMYLKQECEECLSSAELASNQRLLGPIQETEEQENEQEERLVSMKFTVKKYKTK